MPTTYEKLSALLKELFQLDQADLDFGIYRIMNQKREEVTRFLDGELLPQVKTAFAQYHPADKKVLEEKLEQASHSAVEAGFDPEQSPRVKELREQLATYSVDTGALENEVYSHLYSFFRRYYDNGDFISMRRYKEGVYAIPYEGEEVKLHWANADQYYVKTTENFRDYAFRLPSDRLAHFKIIEAETEKDNVKTAEEKERRFILSADKPIGLQDEVLILRFEYRADPEKREQKTLNTMAVETILAGVPAEWAADLKTLAPTEANPRRTLLEKHLADYTARNTFDYFIHKDLRGFLRRELDFYIKNEVMRLDDIEDEAAPRVEQYLSKIKVIRSIAHKIIEFLAQIEDFQKKLWLKKKFVIETNYCITLDRVPEELYPEICANDAQREEWVHLFAIDEIKGDLLKPGYSVPLTVAFLKANPFLVLDTKFIDRKFVELLLAGIENIDEYMDGFLIHSENFQALHLIMKRYRDQIGSIYIDPPYNTSASEIIYKNNYKSSSWLSFIENRITLGKSLLSKTGMQCITIDDFEFHKLREIISNLFGGEDFIAGVAAIKSNPSGRSTVKGFSIAHEYAIFTFASEDAKIGMIPRTKEQLAQYGEEDGLGKFQWRSFIRSGGGNDFRSARPKLFYPLIISNNEVILPDLMWNEQKMTWEIKSQHSVNGKVIYPISNGIEYTWRLGVDTLKNRLKDLRVRTLNTGKLSIDVKFYIDEEGVLPKTIWDEKQFNATAYGTTVLRNIMGVSQSFAFPKSIYAVEQSLRVCGANNPDIQVLDYFAGSGTTGHAVINLNRADGGNRKYVLVEMGNYFNLVTKPRIQKVIYSKDWKDGKPVSREGSSHCFKYLCLESYEDTLNNLVLRRSPQQQLALEASPEFKENYLLSYMLDVESQGSLLNIQSFVHPFDYKLNIATGAVGESKPTPVDLVETFNYLIGLRVENIQSIRGFRVVTGRNPAGEKTLIIWRDLEEKSNADLEEFFRKQDYNPRDMEFDLIYVNGDNNLENLRRPDETWKVRLIEEEFLRLMFEEN